MKKVVILGGGVSGRAAERLAQALGMDCRIVSDGPGASLGEAELVVASPGVHPLKSALYREARESGAELISELEFGFRHFPRPVLAVTGTNGKTTTTELTAWLLEALGVRAVTAGNIGVPLSEFAATAVDGGNLPEVAVVEVSSFQLELVRDFAPAAAVLLNLASDHEDRYRGGFAEYCEVKKRIFDRVPEAGRVYGLSFPEASRRVTVADGTVFADGRRLFRLAETPFQAPHNIENLAAALELVLRFVPPEQFFVSGLVDAVRDFRFGAHRIELVGEIDGVKYINDSKATNPAAVLAAAAAVDGPLVLLLGGLDKGMDFSALSTLAPRLRAAVLFGGARERIAAVLPPEVETVDCGTDFPAAVEVARTLARPGDTVLLSPACASMDMFRDYRERGEIFRRLVGVPVPE